MTSYLVLSFVPAACRHAAQRLKNVISRAIGRPLVAAAPAADAAHPVAEAANGPGVRIFNNRNGGDGPPDLDQLWRDFNRRLSDLFSGGGSAGGGGSGDGRGPQSADLRGAGIGLGLVGGLLFLVWAGSGVFIVQEGQQAVVMSFGRFSHISGAGMQWRLPYPFQSHEVVPVSALRSVDVGGNVVTANTGLRESSMLTQDENIVDIRFTVQYRVKDAKDYLFVNRDPDGAVLSAAESAVREIVGNSTMDSVLYQQRDALAINLVRLVQTQLDRVNAGILISNVNVQSVQAPEPVQAAFDDASRAVADRERFKNEGQSYANEVLPKAQSAAVRLREEAQGYRATVVATAEGDAERFKRVYDEYRKAPTVTRDRLYTDTMRDIYANASKVVVDARAGSNLLYLPLDKLIQQTGAGAPAAGGNNGQINNPQVGTAGSQDAQPSPTLLPDSRARESGRSRDRDGR